jgi:hypothetical protein
MTAKREKHPMERLSPLRYSRRERVNVKDIDPTPPFKMTMDRELIAQLAAVGRGEMKMSARFAVPLADLVVFEPADLMEAERYLNGRGAGVEAAVRELLLRRELVFCCRRAPDGRIITADDHVPYLVAKRLGLDAVFVRVPEKRSLIEK